MDNELLNEGFLDDAKQAASNLIELKKEWKKKADSFVAHKWIYRYINERQKIMIDKYYKMLTDEDTTYSNYKKGFRFICQFMGLPYKDVILENITFSNDEKDKQQLKMNVRYSKGRQEVKIPKSTCLIHVSQVDNINELIPSFRSKTKGKYMYPSKRVFFTVTKAISGFKGGNLNSKTFKYITKKDYTSAYIDPTYADFSDGAVYIETDTPIPVMKMKFKMNNLFNLRREKDQSIEESYVEEGFKDLIDNIKNWKISNEASSKKVFKSTTVTDEDYMMLKDVFKTLHTADYPEYKKAFDKLCRFCHIVPRGTIITKHELSKSKEEDKNILYVEYSYNTRKIPLPSDYALYHMSKVGNIKALEPKFRGKSEKGYLYDKPRIYFTINKNLPKAFADYKLTDKMYKYKCLKDVKNVFVDPLVRNGLLGAVYIEINTPVPVEQLN